MAICLGLFLNVALPVQAKTTATHTPTTTQKILAQTPLLPVVQELKELIENDPELLMLFTQMFEEVPLKAPYLNDPTGKPQIRSYQQMLQEMSRILTQAPEFNQTGLVGFPLNAILNWPMATHAGASAFLNPKVNRQLKKYWPNGPFSWTRLIRATC